jgi:NAD(P)-dependent dehydrogenase (short-subunit alcohol dehydrogenase family)
MTTLENKTALVTGASRGIGRATAVALAEAGHTSWFTMAAPRRKRSLSSQRFKRKAAARMQSRRIWELRTEQHCSPNRCAQSSAIDWMYLC